MNLKANEFLAAFFQQADDPKAATELWFALSKQLRAMNPREGLRNPRVLHVHQHRDPWSVISPQSLRRAASRRRMKVDSHPQGQDEFVARVKSLLRQSSKPPPPALPTNEARERD